VAKWQEFIKRCMKAKNLKGAPAEVVREEMAKCVEAGKKILAEKVPKEIDEEELARRIL